MKNGRIGRLLALLLALAMLLSAAGLAEGAAKVEVFAEPVEPAANEGAGELGDMDLYDPQIHTGNEIVSEDTYVELSATGVKLGVKESFVLSAEVSPASRRPKLRFASTNTDVAAVGPVSGKIVAKKAGSTVIQAKIGGKVYAKCKVKVVAAPTEVTLNKTALNLTVGDSFQLKAKIAKGTYTSKYTWASSNTSVATVDENGLVIAEGAGKAKIVVKTANGKKAACIVTVTGSGNATKYRALLIGEIDFDPLCTRNQGDVLRMEKMLKSVKGPTGGTYTITKKYDLDKEGIFRAIKRAYAGADSNDVSLFFIATHGDVDTSGETAGAMAVIPEGPGSYILMGELADALKAIPGKMIVIIESCGSGAAVYANASGKARLEKARIDMQAFDAAVVKAFSDADCGILVDDAGNAVAEGNAIANTGEFRVANKFYVLTASRYQELSWGMEYYDASVSYNMFTLWLTQGIGTSGKMPADADKNGKTTLNELFKYIQKVGDHEPMDDGEKVYYQHVQVYPSGSNYALFKR